VLFSPDERIDGGGNADVSYAFDLPNGAAAASGNARQGLVRRVN
jgi:hypothetical protein